MAMCAFILFFVIKKTMGLRVSAAEEIGGLDLPEHGLTTGYAGFMPSISQDEVEEAEEAGIEIPMSQAVPVLKTGKSGKSAKMSKVVIITRQNKFEKLKMAMDQIGVTGMTVINVMGCGMQKGASEYYRGAPVDMNLLPKIKG